MDLSNFRCFCEAADTDATTAAAAAPVTAAAAVEATATATAETAAGIRTRDSATADRCATKAHPSP